MHSRCLADPPQAGFSLITISILLTVAALVFVSVLPGKEAGDYGARVVTSTQKLQYVENAMRAFMAFNGRRPCPADGQYNVNNANFGVEAATPGTCTGGTPAAPFGPDAGTSHIVGGVIPTKALNIPDDYAFDEWGRRFTYVVDQRATKESTCYTLQNYPTNNGTGGVKIESTNGGTVLDNTMYAYISHGPDGFGAFPAQGSSVANRLNTGSTDADQCVNAGVSSDGLFTYNTTNFTNVKVKKDKTATFDDLVYYRNDIKNICCLGSAACIAAGCTPPAQTGFRIDGASANNWSGNSLAFGNVNGDGITDLIIGARNAAPGGVSRAGSTYVVFGTQSGFPDPLPLSSLNGANGFRIDGMSTAIYSGYSVAAGNVNKDGYADIIIGALGAGGAGGNGAVYVIFGKGTWSRSSYTLDNNATTGLIDGTKGFELDGVSADNAGNSLAVGNVNKDGYADIIIGADNASSNGNVSGSTYVVFGKSGVWPATNSLASGGALIDGTHGFRLDGATASDQAGYHVAAGNVNKDGYADIIISTPLAKYNGNVSGSTYVVFGKSGAWSATNLLTSGGALIDGTHGFRLDGATAGDQSGASVAAGDINNDG